jgi:hypothetical protein
MTYQTLNTGTEKCSISLNSITKTHLNEKKCAFSLSEEWILPLLGWSLVLKENHPLPEGKRCTHQHKNEVNSV